MEASGGHPATPHLPGVRSRDPSRPLARNRISRIVLISNHSGVSAVVGTTPSYRRNPIPCTVEDGAVRFRFRDYRQPLRHIRVRLAAEEFIRRFLCYVLARDFHRIRHSSFLAGCHRNAKPALRRRLLGMPPGQARVRPSS